MPVHIRPVGSDDRESWSVLWRQFCDFYKVTLAEHIHEKTWEQLLSPESPIFALVAEDEAGRPLGICNYVCHPHTYSEQKVCFLEDLFVSPEARRLGIATQFIETLKDIGRRENWFRIYWVTEAGNERAQAVYDKVATRTDHVRYEIAL